ncbi:MAG: GntR family transcriptional regulator, partial [Candidatus Binatia bacterium]
MTDKAASVVDQISETIKEGVRLGNYVPGQRLIENDFVSELGFSRGPLREALRRLEAEGVVLLEKNRGAVVRRWSREDIEHLYDVRELLEPQAARLAAELVASDPERQRRLESSLRRMRKTAEDAVSDYVRENVRFHVLIAELSGNSWL